MLFSTSLLLRNIFSPKPFTSSISSLILSSFLCSLSNADESSEYGAVFSIFISEPDFLSQFSIEFVLLYIVDISSLMSTFGSL